MKNILRKSFVSVIAALTLIFSSCTNQNVLEFYDAETVTINGEVTENLHVEINRKKVAHVPIIELLTELGFEVVWKDSSTAVVSILEKEYVISLVEKTILLTDCEGDYNYIMACPGTQYYFCEVVGNDIIVDDDTANNFLGETGVRCYFSVNYRKMTVSIETPNLAT